MSNVRYTCDKSCRTQLYNQIDVRMLKVELFFNK